MKALYQFIADHITDTIKTLLRRPTYSRESNEIVRLWKAEEKAQARRDRGLFLETEVEAIDTKDQHIDWLIEQDEVAYYEAAIDTKDQHIDWLIEENNATTAAAIAAEESIMPEYQIIATIADGSEWADEAHVGHFAGQPLTEAEAHAALEYLRDDIPEGHEQTTYRAVPTDSSTAEHALA